MNAQQTRPARTRPWMVGIVPAVCGALGLCCVELPGPRAVSAAGAAPETQPAQRPATVPATQPARASPWEADIRRFEARDKQAPPPKGQILFLGSSSIRGWDTPKSFPDLQTINRGFGGSQIADSVQFAERIALPYRPRVIVFYAGDNDVAARKTPQTVLADFQALVRKVHEALPKTRIVFVAIKPSLSRWRLWDKMKEANGLIEAYCRTDPRLEFLDIAKPMLGPDGTPRKELFRPDGLHLNAEGYKLWTSLLRPHLAPANGK